MSRTCVQMQPTLTGQPSQPRPRAGGGHRGRAHRTAWPGREHPAGARGGRRARRAAGPRRGGPGRGGGGGGGGGRRSLVVNNQLPPRERGLRPPARPTAQYFLYRAARLVGLAPPGEPLVGHVRGPSNISRGIRTAARCSGLIGLSFLY